MNGFPRLYLDLDGAMADFDAHFPAVFGEDHRAMDPERLWRLIALHPTFFRDMPLCDGAYEFWEWVSAFDPIIIAACPHTEYASAARQKRAWVREDLLPTVTVLPVLGGRNKALFMHGAGDVLIDDTAVNCTAWENEGGIAIQHTSFTETARRLEGAIGRRGALPRS